MGGEDGQERGRRSHAIPSYMMLYVWPILGKARYSPVSKTILPHRFALRVNTCKVLKTVPGIM